MILRAYFGTACGLYEKRLLTYPRTDSAFLTDDMGDTAAKVGRDLRAGVFRSVVSFSSAEIDRFSTASLITRSTNDIQQIQMVIVMLLRMVIYAPILGIGGVFMVLTTGTGMAWIIALAVIVILMVVLILMKIAMPKFKLMLKQLRWQKNFLLISRN